MATANAVFIDTNILVYANLSKSPWHTFAKKRLQLLDEQEVELWIGRQTQVHDANIVATMLAYGIPRLLTHNVDDFKRFAHLIAVLPLVEN